MADENHGNTFPVFDPTKKIDYIWISKNNLEKVSKVTIPFAIQYSDHLPLEAEVSLINN